MNILLIEDQREDALLFCHALEVYAPGKYNVAWVDTLSAALDKLESEKYDAAVLDHSLPDVHELDGLISIQALAAYLPVIFYTACKDEYIAEQAIRRGAQDYLYKDKPDGKVIARAIKYAMLRKEFEETLITQANYDRLTGLANKGLFESRLDMSLARMRRFGGNTCVLFMDMDHFKWINDTHGHVAADQLLRDVGTRLAQSLRSYDTAARFGGDEFAILLERIPEGAYAENVAKKIIRIFDAPFHVDTDDVQVNVSIGIAACPSSAPESGHELLRRADIAMYQAKSIQGCAYKTYAPEMERVAKQA